MISYTVCRHQVLLHSSHVKKAFIRNDGQRTRAFDGSLYSHGETYLCLPLSYTHAPAIPHSHQTEQQPQSQVGTPIRSAGQTFRMITGKKQEARSALFLIFRLLGAFYSACAEV